MPHLINKFVPRGQGFTLLEAMAVLVILAILASFAYPSYLSAVRKAKRAEAQAALMQLMQQQERYYSQNNSYAQFSSSSSGEIKQVFKWYSGETAAGSAYEIRATACEGQSLRECVRLIAIPGTDKVQRGFSDPACGSLMFDSSGQKTATGNATDCWY